MMLTKETYLLELQDQLKAWSSEVDELIARVGVAGMNAKSQLRLLVQKFADGQEAIRRQLETLEQAGDRQWGQQKDELVQLMTSLQEQFDQLKRAAQSAGQESIGWAQGLAEKDDVSSIGWAEGLAEEDVVESLGWAQGVAEEDVPASIGWAEGFEKKS